MPMGPPNIAAGIVPSYEQLRALATAPDTPPVLRTRVLDMLRRNREGREARPVAEQAGLAKATPTRDGLTGVEIPDPDANTTDWSNPPDAYVVTPYEQQAQENAKIEGQRSAGTGLGGAWPQVEQTYSPWLQWVQDYFNGGGQKSAEGKSSLNVKPEMMPGNVATDGSSPDGLTGVQMAGPGIEAAIPYPEAKPDTTEAHYADATTAGAMPMWAASDSMPGFPAMPEMPEPKGIAAAAATPATPAPQTSAPPVEQTATPPATGLDGMSDWQYGLLAAGLGILGADPRKGLLGAIGEGGMAMLQGMNQRRAETRADQRYAEERADRREEHEWNREDRAADRDMRREEFTQRMTADAAEREDRWRLAQYNAQMGVWAKKIGMGLDYARLANEAAYRNQSLDLDREKLGIMKAQAEAPTGISKQFAEMADYFNQRGMPRGQAEQQAMQFLQPRMINPYAGLEQDQGIDEQTLNRYGAPVG